MMNSDVARMDALRNKCWEEALHCYGTSYVFERRANVLRCRLRFLTFLGIVVPASVGAVVVSFGANSILTGVFLSFASVLGLIQLIVSIWSLTHRWDDQFGYALESLSANRILYDKFQTLASDPPAELDEAKNQFQLINAENNARSSLDEKQGVTENEKRAGMRAALRQLQKPCAACGQVPTSMTPTDCDVCGNFKQRRF